MTHGLCRTLTLLGSSTFQAAQKESNTWMIQSMCARAQTRERHMDEDGEEFVAQKTRMWSIKLRGAVFRLQIQAINTFETPIKIN